MNDEELKEYLRTKHRFGIRDKLILIDEFNMRLRSHERPITMQRVSSPCRLREVVGSLKKRLE